MSENTTPKLTISLFSDPLDNPFITLFTIVIILYATHFFGVIPIALLFVSIVAHELGHYYAFKRYDMDVQQISISVFNDSYVQSMELKQNITPWQQVWIALSGPLAGLLPLLVLIPIIFVTQSSTLADAAHLILLFNLFNLAPYPGMDGYKCYAGLKGIHEGREKIENVSIKPGLVGWAAFIGCAIMMNEIFKYLLLI